MSKIYCRMILSFLHCFFILLPHSVTSMNLLFQVEVEFGDGSVFKLSAEFLRINSPAVDGKIRSIGGEKVPSALLKFLLNLFIYDHHT